METELVRRADAKRGRPPKADALKLRPVMTAVSADVYRTLERLSATHDCTIAEVVRRVLVGRIGRTTRDALH